MLKFAKFLGVARFVSLGRRAGAELSSAISFAQEIHVGIGIHVQIDPDSFGECDLVQIVYRHRSQLRGAPAEIAAAIGDILTVARLENPPHGITGVMFFDGSLFAQTLEGSPLAIARLYANILEDKRHTDVCLLQQAGVEERSFDGWAMAYVDGSEGSGFVIPSGFLSDSMRDVGEAGTILELMRFVLRPK